MEQEILEITLIYAILIPAAVTGGLLLIVSSRLAPVAVAAGYLIGHLQIQGWPGFPPAESTQWLPWLILVLLIFSIRGPSARRPTWFRWALPSLPILAGSLFLLLLPAFRYSWSAISGPVWLCVLASLGILYWDGVKRLLDQGESFVASIVFLSVTGGNALIVGLSGSVVLSQLAAAQAATVGAGLVVPLVRGKPPILGSVLPLQVVLFVGLAASGWYLVDVNGPSLLILAAVPWIGSGILRFMGEKWPSVYRRVLVILVVTGLVAVSCYLAYLSSPPLDIEF